MQKHMRSRSECFSSIQPKRVIKCWPCESSVHFWILASREQRQRAWACAANGRIADMAFVFDETKGFASFAGLSPFPQFENAEAKMEELLAKHLDHLIHGDCHPVNNNTGSFQSSLRWAHQIEPRYSEDFFKNYRPGYIINIEAKPSKLVSGAVKPADWCISWSLESWMCSTLQYSVYPSKFEHPAFRKKISYEELMTDQKYRSVAEKLIFSKRFRKLSRSFKKGSDRWGEYIVIDATKLSFGPCEYTCRCLINFSTEENECVLMSVCLALLFSIVLQSSHLNSSAQFWTSFFSGTM